MTPKHIHTIPTSCATLALMCMCMVVSNTVRNGDSYKTKNANDGKAKSRDTRATNWEARTKERPANLFMHTCGSLSVSPSLAFMYVSCSRRSLLIGASAASPTLVVNLKCCKN